MREQNFVAVNYITCDPSYVDRFETLFGSRAKAIDSLPGFQHMMVLKPTTATDPYLVVSYWDSESDFQAWTKSDAFRIGHQRAFEDIAAAKAAGKNLPMQSQFRTYEVIAR
jgi:heme-degrading monooxygenase HmoA